MPILGANIWAKELSTSKVYSVVSDFLLQGTGYFRLNLPPGSYMISAESIDSQFYGGSRIWSWIRGSIAAAIGHAAISGALFAASIAYEAVAGR